MGKRILSRDDPVPARSSDAVLLAASFALTAALVLFAFYLNGLVPFGKNSLVVGDAYNQYICFWSYFKDAFLGKQDFRYALEKTLGGNMAGLYAYYGASPFTLLYLFFPLDQFSLCFHLVILLKLSMCSLTMAIYFKYSGGLSWKNLLFCCAYALCEYNTQYFAQTMWLDGVILLPLVALGLRRIFEGSSPWLYIFSLGSAILCCYYIGYMLCIFSVLYAAVQNWIAGGTRRVKLRKTGVFLLSSLAAGGLPAFLLLPALLSMRGGKAPSFWEEAGAIVNSYAYPVLRILCPERQGEFVHLAKYVLCAAFAIGLILLIAAVFFFRSGKIKERIKICAVLAVCLLLFGSGALSVHRVLYSSLGNLQKIYVGQLVLSLAILYFFQKRIPAKEKMGYFALLVFLLASFRFNILNMIWHGFTVTFGFNYRYSFLVSFLLIVLAKRALDELNGISLREAGAVLAVVLVLLTVAYKNGIDFNEFASGALLTMGYTVLLSLFFQIKANPVKAVILSAVVLTHLYTLTFPLSYSLDIYHDSDDVLDTFLDYQNDVAMLRSKDRSLFRARLGTHFNAPMMLGFNSLSHFSSNESAEIVDYLEDLGVAANEGIWASTVLGSTRALDSLFGVKYLSGGSYVDGYAKIDSENAIFLNDCAFPLAFPADEQVTGVSLDPENVFENINRIYQAVAPSSVPAVFRPAPMEKPELRNVEKRSGAYVCSEGAEYGEITYQLKAASPDPLYMYVAGDSESRVDIYLNGARYEEISGERPNRILYLGRFEPGENSTVTLRIFPGLPMEDKLLLCYEDGAAIAACRNAILAGQAETLSDTDSHLLTKVDITKERQCLLFTFPWDAGWKVTVDGEKAQAERGLGLLLTVPLSPGTHTVELRYVPPGIGLGTGISGVTALCLGFFLLREARAGKGKEARPCSRFGKRGGHSVEE